MNQSIKQKWLSALRSGEYKQTKHALRNGDSYCCLGVLCDIYMKENNIPESEWKTVNGSKFTLEGSGDILPLYVSSWCDLNMRRNPEIISEDKTLSSLNDEGKSFTEIANLIEKYL